MKKLTALWIITVALVFILAVLMGILMRLNQANVISLPPNLHYSIMSAHGLLMVGIWFSMAMAGVNYLLGRYVTVWVFPNLFGYLMTLLGALLLLASIFIGGEHPGWYFLYPLPFYAKTSDWAPLVFIISLTVLGLGWFVWSLGMFVSILRGYSLPSALAWSALLGKESKTPPFILITTVTLLGIIACLIAGVIVLVLFFAHGIMGIKTDALLMKNLIFFFGHTLVNEMLYLGIASLYELFPSLAGKPPYKTKWYVALAWNGVLFIVLFAYFHHLYMDFVQPLPLQFIGQIASWIVPIPAVAITVFTVFITVLGAGKIWSLPASLFYLGTLFWVIGGIGAVLDATIMNNFVLHNTLWVPAHFHTYNLLGNVMFSLAFISWFTNNSLRMFLPAYVIGGFGFVLMFYIAGAFSVMRRVDKYPDFASVGNELALLGAAFASLVFLAVIFYSLDVISKSLKIILKGEELSK